MKTYFHFLTFFFCVLLIPTALFAQDASVKGIIYEESSGEPAILANVVLDGTSYGASTDVNGYFLIAKIPPGTYTLNVLYLGFDTITEQIKLEANDVITKQFYIKESSVKLETVEVSANASHNEPKRPLQ